MLKGMGVFSLDRLSLFFDLHRTRPALAPAYYVLGALCGESPFRWQVCAAVLTLAAAIALRHLLRAVLRHVIPYDLRVADLVACLWLVVPWNLGSTAWVSSAPTLLAQVWFCLSGAVFLGARRMRNAALFLVPFLYALSCLTYEAFYGLFAVLVLIGLAGRLWRSIGWPRLIGVCVGFAAAQALSIAWGWYGVRWFHYSPTKSIQPNWLASVPDSLSRIPAELKYALSEMWPAFYYWSVGGAIVLCGGALACALNRCLRRWPGDGAYAQLAMVLVACAAGVVLIATAYATVGYSFAGRGFLSRTTMSLNVLLAIALAAVIGVLLRQSRWLARLTLAWAFGFGSLLFTTQTIRLQAWIDSWATGREVLENMPVSDLEATGKHAFILYVVPEGMCEVAVFGAAWDLNAAMRYRHPQLSGRNFRPTVPIWLNEWDGRALTVSCGDIWSYSVPCTELWLWDPLEHLLVIASPPYRYPPDDSAVAAEEPSASVRAGPSVDSYWESKPKLTVEPISAELNGTYLHRCSVVAEVSASDSLGPEYGPANAVDNDRQTFWCVRKPGDTIDFAFRNPARATRMVIEGRPHPTSIGFDEMTTGDLIINDRTILPFEGFGNQTAIIVDFNGPTEIRKVRVVCERARNYPGVAEFILVH